MSGFFTFVVSRNTVYRTLLILLLSTTGTYAQKNVKPLAVEGRLNLTSWDLTSSPIELKGDWLFYWNEIITPTDDSYTLNKDVENIKPFPGLWTEYEGDVAYPSFGFSTYMLTITGLVKGQEYALKIPDMYCSYQLWIGSTLISSNGQVSANENNYAPEWRPTTINFTAEREEDVILLNIANFDHSKGGIKNAILLGSVKQLNGIRAKDVTSNVMRIIGIALISLASLLCYFFYSKKLFIYFAIFSLFWSLRGLFTDMYLIYTWIPDFSWIVGTKIEYLSIYSSVLVGYYIYHNIFPLHSNKIVSWVSLIVNSIFIIITIVSPAIVFTELLNIYFGCMGLLLAYILINVIQAYIYDEKGAGYLAIAIALIIILFFYDMLSYYKFLPYNPFITSTGYVILYALLAYSLWYNQLHKKVSQVFDHS